MSTTAECRHCGRTIVLDPEDGWIDPEAPATPEAGDDYIWRQTCDRHDSRVADHEPVSEYDLAAFIEDVAASMDRIAATEATEDVGALHPIRIAGESRAYGEFSSLADWCTDAAATLREFLEDCTDGIDGWEVAYGTEVPSWS